MKKDYYLLCNISPISPKSQRLWGSKLYIICIYMYKGGTSKLMQCSISDSYLRIGVFYHCLY